MSPLWTFIIRLDRSCCRRLRSRITLLIWEIFIEFVRGCARRILSWLITKLFWRNCGSMKIWGCIMTDLRLMRTDRCFRKCWSLIFKNLTSLWTRKMCLILKELFSAIFWMVKTPEIEFTRLLRIWINILIYWTLIKMILIMIVWEIVRKIWNWWCFWTLANILLELLELLDSPKEMLYCLELEVLEDRVYLN